MFDAAAKALAQMFTPPFRAVLFKSIGLAILLLVLFGVGLNKLFGWLASVGNSYLDGVTTTSMQMPLHVLIWLLAVSAGFGLFAAALFLMPAITAFVASFFSDEIAAEVEHVHYPADPSGANVPVFTAGIEGIKTALLALLIYFCAVPFIIFGGLGFLVLFIANAYLLGREYFLLAAMRFRSVEDAKALRKRHHGTVFTAGLFIAAFVSIPILNLATPLFGMAFMTHMHKRIAGPRRELIEHT